MKISLLNCLFFFVAIAAIVAWRTDKARFESALSNFGEELPDPEWEIKGPNVLDSFSIGDVTFVFLDSDIRVPEESARGLADVDHPANAATKARPSELMLSIIGVVLGMEHELSFEEATVVDYGSDGHFWKITWSLYPTQGGFGGFPFQCLGFVRGDGSPVAPRVVLRDHFGSWYSNQQNMIFSVLPLEELAPPGNSNHTQQEIVDFAEQHLERRLKELDIPVQFKFDSIAHRTFSGRVQSNGPDCEVGVWAVDFVDKSIPTNVNNENSSTKITIWVTNELKTSNISVGTWTIDPDTHQVLAE